MTNGQKILNQPSRAQNIKNTATVNLTTTPQPKQISLLELPDFYHRLMVEAAMFIGIKEAEFLMWLNHQAGITQMNAITLCLAITQYGLNPFLGEIILISQKEMSQLEAPQASQQLPKIAFITVVGWNKIINAHPQFCGIQFIESVELGNGFPSWIECVIMRRDRELPITVREYLIEVTTEESNWQTTSIRMLRYKAMAQCARLAFGISMPQGIHLQSSVAPFKETCKSPTKTNGKMSNTAVLKNLLR